MHRVTNIILHTARSFHNKLIDAFYGKLTRAAKLYQIEDVKLIPRSFRPRGFTRLPDTGIF